MNLKKKHIWGIMALLLGGLLCACGKETGISKESFYAEKTESAAQASIDKEAAQQWEKGYDLPLDELERQEAEDDCKRAMLGELKETGCPVTTKAIYSDMENYEKMDLFLEGCEAGKSGSIVTYEIYDDGTVGRMKYIFDGKSMYVVSAKGAWNEENEPVMSYISYNRIKEWKYTDKGWFGYKICVPEPPEVTEIVDGSCLVRVKPMTPKAREMSEKCVQAIGYQGNNLFCSDWDADHMENLDYNGLYEYLYAMKYRKTFDGKAYPNGIPEEEFESLIMEYLPVTAEQIREYAVFDKEKQTYAWAGLGSTNVTHTYVGSSIPEVTDIKENEDGATTLTVDAVCDMVVCDDALITHELTVKFDQDGSFQYLSNKILGDGKKNIPDYSYRCQYMKGNYQYMK